MRPQPLLLLLLTLPWTPVSAAQIVLSNGDRLTGQIVEQSVTTVTLDHPQLGRLVIDRNNIAPGERLVKAETVEPAVLPPTQALKRRIEAGLNGSNGNSRDRDFRLGYQARNESDLRRLLLKTAYQKSSSDGETDENDFYVELTHDWLLPQSPWFRFAQGRYDWDDFEDWDSRLNLSGGVGYGFYDRADFTLNGRLGAGFNQTWGGDDDQLEPEGIVGVDSRWKINPGQSLEFANTLYPELDEMGEFRNLTHLAWVIKLDQFSGLALKFGIENEYESSAAGESKKNDFKYDLSLTWELD
ncbi:MAG: DUF481 domain-containing protein [Gammaproteobacteria bacterium]